METKQLNPRQIRWLKKLVCYDFAIKYIKNENNVGADALSRKPNYKNPNKLIKPLLVKKSNYMQITEATEKNNDIIRDVNDTKLSGHQRIFKTLKKIQEKTTWKNIKTDVEKYVKNYPICAKGKHDRSRKKKITSTFTTTRGSFSETCVGFCHWVTGIPKPSNRNML